MDLSKRSRNMIFTVMMIGTIISSMLQTALTTALPAIMSDLAISATTAQWLTNVYSLTMGIMMPATAFLIKRIPTRKLYIGAISLFAVGLLLCASSTTFPSLLIGRIIQAMGNGILMSITQVVILTIFPIEKRGSVMGIYGLAAGAAPVFAPTLAGIVIDIFSWQAIFWFAFIITVLDIILATKVIKNVLENVKQRFDTYSMVLCAAGFGGILLGLGNLGTSEFFSPYICLPLIVGTIALILFSLRQFRIEAPFLELRILRNKDYRIAVIISMLLYSVMIAGSTLFPIYIQLVRGFSATQCGLIMMPGSLAMSLISPFAGKFYDKFGIRKLIVWGSAALVISCLGVSFLGNDTSALYISFFLVVRLISVGLLLMPVTTWGMSKIEKDNTAHGTALLSSLRTISGAMGSAIFVSVMTAATIASSGSAKISANVYGINVAFMCITVVAVVQFLLALFFVEKHNPK